MSRPRNRLNSSLPENLYRKDDKRTNKTYYTYRDPRTGKSHGLGTDKESAMLDARALNAAIYTSIRTAQITAISNREISSPKLCKVLERHLELCADRKLSANTMRTKKCQINAWKKALGNDTHLNDITVRNIVEILTTYQDRPRMAQSMRSAAIDIWKDAIEEGWANDNIPAKTRGLTAEVKRSRLTLEDYNKIHAVALQMKDKWIVRAMELALVTAQRREDISSMEFRPTKDSSAWIEGNTLCVIQHKTKNRLRIPLEVGINGMSITSVIKSCRDNVISKWLIHHARNGNLSKPGDQVWIDTISRRFADVRDLAGVKAEEGKTPPSFHEIRSLAIRLYSKECGKEFAQAIAGHKDASTSELYQDVRGSEWVQVNTG